MDSLGLHKLFSEDSDNIVYDYSGSELFTAVAKDNPYKEIIPRTPGLGLRLEKLLKDSLKANPSIDEIKTPQVSHEEIMKYYRIFSGVRSSSISNVSILKILDSENSCAIFSPIESKPLVLPKIRDNGADLSTEVKNIPIRNLSGSDIIGYYEASEVCETVQ